MTISILNYLLLTLHEIVKIDYKKGFAKGDVYIKSEMLSFVIYMGYEDNNNRRKIVTCLHVNHQKLKFLLKVKIFSSELRFIKDLIVHE